MSLEEKCACLSFYTADTSSILWPSAVLVETGEGFGVCVQGDAVWLQFCFASQTLIPAGQQQLGGLSRDRIWFLQQQEVLAQRRERPGGRKRERGGRVGIWRNPCSLLAVCVLFIEIKKVQQVACRFRRQHAAKLPIVSPAPKVYFYPPWADCSRASTVVVWPSHEPKREEIQL